MNDDVISTKESTDSQWMEDEHVCCACDERRHSMTTCCNPGHGRWLDAMEER